MSWCRPVQLALITIRVELLWCHFPQFWGKYKDLFPALPGSSAAAPCQRWLSTGLALLAGRQLCWHPDWLVSSVPVGREPWIHVNDFSMTHRCSRGLSQDRNPSSIVIHLHVGEWDHDPSPTAHA